MHSDSIRALASCLFAMSFVPGCTDPGRCLVGSEACACDAQGECSESHLTCEHNRCVECTPGTLGCSCGAGSTCAGSAQCLEGDCVPAIEALCTDTCLYAHDGECDDDGPGSITSECGYGTDCNDCGARANVCAHDPDAPQLCHLSTNENGCFSSSIDCSTAMLCGSTWITCESGHIVDCGTSTEGDEQCRAQLCTNGCSDANDGFCDDGGPQSSTNICAFGTDCGDCGARDPVSTCADSCPYSGDGECDDGGPGAMFYVCVYGTDCADCGESTPPATACVDSCSYAGDNECDDGGAGATSLACDFGTDCTDCGTRSP